MAKKKDVPQQAGAGDGGLESGPINIKWIKIMPNRDTVLNQPDPETTRRVFFGGETTDDPAEPFYGYFDWSAYSLEWVTILAEAFDDPTKLVDCKIGDAEVVNHTFHHQYIVFTTSYPPPFSINDELQSHPHLPITAIARH